MSELLIGEFLLLIAFLLAATFLFGRVLIRVHIPVMLGGLLIAMTLHYSPLGEQLLGAELYPVFSFLADLGMMLLLFFIGLQIDLKAMRSQRKDIVWLTLMNTSVPFLLGGLVMLSLGYGWLLAFVVGLTCMPTAEAVIVPILDDFDLIRTRIGGFIVGAGVLDDIIEVFLVAFVSVWISERAASGLTIAGVENEGLSLMVSTGLFALTTWSIYRFILPKFYNWLPQEPRYLFLLSMLVLLTLAGFTEYTGLGMVVGAILAGVVLRPLYTALGSSGRRTHETVRTITYGFFGLVFLFWVGLSVDLEGLMQEPLLAILLFLAATTGKLSGAMILVLMKKLTVLEGWTIGVGINARLTTEIIVAKLLLDANLIDIHLFTALVAASSLSTILVPLVFTYIVRRWRAQLEMMGTVAGF